MIETAFALPKKSKRWTVELLEDPEILAAFERKTARKIHRGCLMSKHPFCTYCGKRLTHKAATLDHLIPLSRGGTDDRENLVLSCQRCNLCKADRTPEEWAADILASRDKTAEPCRPFDEPTNEPADALEAMAG